MNAWRACLERVPGQRGSSLLELLTATSIGLSLAALLGYTVTAFQADYRRSVTRIGGDQQARFALALLADELDALLDVPPSATCPPPGVQIETGRVEFTANLYGRTTRLRGVASPGGLEIAVEPGGTFEAGDLVMIVDVKAPQDPGDDLAECVRIADIATGRWTLQSPLPGAFPAGSPVALVNRVVYALDRVGRLMRTQDGGTQRVAQDVEAFHARLDGASVVVRLALRPASAWTRRIVLKDAP